MYGIVWEWIKTCNNRDFVDALSPVFLCIIGFHCHSQSMSGLTINIITEETLDSFTLPNSCSSSGILALKQVIPIPLSWFKRYARGRDKSSQCLLPRLNRLHEWATSCCRLLCVSKITPLSTRPFPVSSSLRTMSPSSWLTPILRFPSFVSAKVTSRSKGSKVFVPVYAFDDFTQGDHIEGCPEAKDVLNTC